MAEKKEYSENKILKNLDNIIKNLYKNKNSLKMEEKSLFEHYKNIKNGNESFISKEQFSAAARHLKNLHKNLSNSNLDNTINILFKIFKTDKINFELFKFFINLISLNAKYMKSDSTNISKIIITTSKIYEKLFLLLNKIEEKFTELIKDGVNSKYLSDIIKMVNPYQIILFSLLGKMKNRLASLNFNTLPESNKIKVSELINLSTNLNQKANFIFSSIMANKIAQELVEENEQNRESSSRGGGGGEKASKKGDGKKKSVSASGLNGMGVGNENMSKSESMGGSSKEINRTVTGSSNSSANTPRKSTLQFYNNRSKSNKNITKFLKKSFLNSKFTEAKKITNKLNGLLKDLTQESNLFIKKAGLDLKNMKTRLVFKSDMLVIEIWDLHDLYGHMTFHYVENGAGPDPIHLKPNGSNNFGSSIKCHLELQRPSNESEVHSQPILIRIVPENLSNRRNLNEAIKEKISFILDICAFLLTKLYREDGGVRMV